LGLELTCAGVWGPTPPSGLASLALAGDHRYARTLITTAAFAAEKTTTAVVSYKTALREIGDSTPDAGDACGDARSPASYA
jgi:hypothetical protein